MGAATMAAERDDFSSKLEAAPDLKLPPKMVWVKGPDGKTMDANSVGITFLQKVERWLSILVYNSFITHIPSHVIRQSYLRLFGADIGKDSAVMRGTTVIDIKYLTIGNCTAIGSRCLLDARGGLWIGDNVTIASDVHILGGGHDINDPDFLPVPIPTVIEDYVWIASRAMILPSHIRRGAVVAASSLVNKDVDELVVVGGIPAKPISKRNPDALKYSGKYRPIFH
ncbi:MAG: acyltransferase [Mycolicibacterium sp.]|nr:acyltransferase [Mycolicibacterium sp.]